MIDVGVTEKQMYPEAVSTSKTKNRVIYPSLYIEKDIGDFKIGQKVKLTCSAVVTSLRKDRTGVKTSFEIKEMGIDEKLSREDVGSKVADEYFDKKGL